MCRDCLLRPAPRCCSLAARLLLLSKWQQSEQHDPGPHSPCGAPHGCAQRLAAAAECPGWRSRAEFAHVALFREPGGHVPAGPHIRIPAAAHTTHKIEILIGFRFTIFRNPLRLTAFRFPLSSLSDSVLKAFRRARSAQRRACKTKSQNQSGREPCRERRSQYADRRSQYAAT